LIHKQLFAFAPETQDDGGSPRDFSPKDYASCENEAIRDTTQRVPLFLVGKACQKAAIVSAQFPLRINIQKKFGKCKVFAKIFFFLDKKCILWVEDIPMSDTLSDLAEIVITAAIAAAPEVSPEDIKEADLEQPDSFPVAKAIMLAVSLSIVVAGLVTLAFAI
jgi:hypothetical protein